MKINGITIEIVVLLDFYTEQVSEVIWQRAASPTCHSSRLRLDSSDLDPVWQTDTWFLAATRVTAQKSTL